jgi:gamma-D-glutamyl-L-lysine dipeptidyl-peptidase
VSRRADRRAVVSIAALDVRRRPDHRAELGSQLLAGEVVRVLGGSRDRRWREVENLADGYRGWVRDWGLLEGPATRIARWSRAAAARVAALFVEVRVRPGAGALLSPLFWNARVILGGARGPHARIELPDGRRGWMPRRALAEAVTRRSLADRAGGLLGIPYLWGGRTPLGFDCSGLTQQLLVERGVPLPRDAREQFEASKELRDGEQPRPGDLVFFGARGRPVGHVGIGLGGTLYAHCRGVVRLSSMDPRNPLYDKELAPQFRGWRRPRSSA